MAFKSILFKNGASREKDEMPDFFRDLNLNRFVEEATEPKKEYDLKPFFFIRPEDKGEIEYRQDVVRDLEKTEIFDAIDSFADGMRKVRRFESLEKKLSHKYQKERWFLDAVDLYCNSVIALKRRLSDAKPKSRGFSDFIEYLGKYTESERFMTLFETTKKLKRELAGIEYSVFVKGNTVSVRRFESEKDYSEEILKTFERFDQGSAKDYGIAFEEIEYMNHVEEKILDFVAHMHPEIFSGLDEYRTQNADYKDEKISVFDREVQFYIAYLEYTVPLKRRNLDFCYPEISTFDKNIYARETFDIVLARKLIREESPIVVNDLNLEKEERIFVVSGPNQGGKTTFARTFGQIHYLGALGFPIPGKKAKIFLFDRIFTHFEREEKAENLRSKLEDDLVRIHRILSEATSDSIVIMNEIFSSTALKDALFLGGKVMERVTRLGSIAVLVTFMDELAVFNENVVSMVSTVVPERPEVRTYRILRRPADGISYAVSIAEKYRLTYDQLKERIRR